MQTQRHPEQYIVRRYGPGPGERQDYGPFEDRMVAELVAVGATEKHEHSKVFIDVEPVNPRPVSPGPAVVVAA